MPLMEHLRELRRRVFVSVIALVPGVVLGWIFYDELVHFLSAPICDVPVGGSVGGGSCGPLVINGLLGPFNLQVKVALAASNAALAVSNAAAASNGANRCLPFRAGS